MARNLKIILGILFLVSILDVNSQERRSIQRVRREIQQLEAELKTKEEREKTLSEQVEDIERKIGLQRRLLEELEVQKKDKERSVQATAESLEKMTRSYQRLKQVVARRIVSMYKRGRIADWEALFSMRSLNQAMVLLKYQKRIVENDRRNLRLLQDKRATIQTQNHQLEVELLEKNRLIQESVEENRNLDEQKRSRKELLKRARQDRESIQKQLENKRMAFKAIEGRITREEEKRETSAERFGGTRFAEIKGKMMWPVKGKVVSKYGIQRSLVFDKIEWRNWGIEIEAADRDEVRAVHRGYVLWLTWQRGMGNIVLLNHGDGYYTVYGHLDLVFVSSGDEVEEGEVIGRVGDREGLNGSNLNFGIYKGRKHVDPQTWLR